MNLSTSSLEWAIRSLRRHGDTDLFPRPVELTVLDEMQPKSVEAFAAIDLGKQAPTAPRRFIVPKDDLSYRAATQLDPLDSVLLTALIHQYGALIEARRQPSSGDSVFSYRFAPTPDGDLYDASAAWNAFWTRCHALSHSFSHALVVDIADFYNQISHHAVENQLESSGVPEAAIKWILSLLKVVSSSVSRGIPVGPHPCHLLAEASLIPIDNSLQARGLRFCRFVDDIVIFAKSSEEARRCLFEVAEVLDKQQRLHLQNSKTRVLPATALRALCVSSLEDRPINDLERELLGIVAKYSKGNPYRTVFLSELSPEELRSFDPSSVQTILGEYLSEPSPDFPRLRWFLRRLSQVGHPAALPFCLEHFEQLTPAISEICHYLVSVSHSDVPIDWPSTGESLLRLLDSPVVRSNEYFQLSILSLFGRVAPLDHTARLLARYRTASPFLRREILLAAAEAMEADWLREFKEDVTAMDPWTKRAFLFASRCLPTEERGFFLRKLQFVGPLEPLLALWARR